MKVNTWEHFHHVADIGVRGFGSNPAESFAQAAIALTAVITDPDQIKPLKPVHVSCQATDQELLFYDWLNTLIYEMAVRHMLFSKFDITMDNLQLSATIWGEAIDIGRHTPSVEVKGATFTELKVYKSKNNVWVAQCIVDV